MNIEIKLSKAEYEPVLLDLVNRSLQRQVDKSEIQQISLTYHPDAETKMTIVLISPGP